MWADDVMNILLRQWRRANGRALSRALPCRLPAAALVLLSLPGFAPRPLPAAEPAAGKPNIAFMEKNRDRPFFLYFATHVVHKPIRPKPELQRAYELNGLPKEGPGCAAYAAFVHSADENVGRILRALDEMKRSEQTVVFFMSDNGGRVPETSNAPLRGGKGELYEGGIRDPMIIRWPGVVAPGSVCDVPVISNDFYPTILEMAGIERTPERLRDGTSLVPLCKGGTALPREALYWHYPHFNDHPAGRPSGAVRRGDWKLVEFFEDGRLELYNLKEDLGEKANRSERQPALAKELQRMLAAWRKEVGAQMPTRRR